MRYAKEHNDATRARIIATASRLFRRDGIAAIGVAPLMKAVGLTHGTFYTHFQSKDDLVREMLADIGRRRLEAIGATLAQQDGIEQFLRAYLSERHRDTDEGGCPNASLSAEVARSSDGIRAIYTNGYCDLVEMLAARLTHLPQPERRKAAMAIFAMMAGSIEAARAVNDPQVSRDILDGALGMALELACPARNRSGDAIAAPAGPVRVEPVGW